MKKYSETIINTLATSIGIYEVINIGKEIDYLKHVFQFIILILVVELVKNRFKSIDKKYSDTFPQIIKFMQDVLNFVQLIFINILVGIAIQKISSDNSENYSQGLVQKYLFYFSIVLMLKAIETMYSYYFDQKSNNSLYEKKNDESDYKRED